MGRIKKWILWSGTSLAGLALAGCSLLAGAQFGQPPAGEDLARLKTSPNHENGQFQNYLQDLKADEKMSFMEMLKAWMFDRGTRAPKMDMPVRKISQMRLNDHQTHVTWLGHSTMLIELDDKIILTDPVFSDHASPYSWMPPRSFYKDLPIQLEDIGWVDAVVISHDHYDHLDHKTIRHLQERVGRFIVPLGVGSHLRYWEVPSEKIVELDWWQETKLGNVTFTATPAQHFSGRSLTGGNETLWSGWAIRGRDSNLFYSGDSAYFPGFKEIGDRLGPFDLTMIECGAYNAAWSHVHMYPEQSAQAHLDLKGRRMMPVHWGRFDLAMHGWTEPAERLFKAAREQQISLTLPMIGQRFSLEGDHPEHLWWQGLDRELVALQSKGKPATAE